jgi:hypothetical protein
VTRVSRPPCFLSCSRLAHSSTALEALDLDADWDPTAHDQQMADLYGDAGDVDFDGGADEDADLDKPVWDDDIDISDLVPADSSKPAKKKKKKAKKGGADVDAAEGIDMDAMDADVTRALEEEEWDGTEEDRKRLVARYMDEMAGLEFNDLVRRRFHPFFKSRLTLAHRSATSRRASSIPRSIQTRSGWARPRSCARRTRS